MTAPDVSPATREEAPMTDEQAETKENAMPDPIMDENTATAEQADEPSGAVQFLLRAANAAHNDFQRCRDAGNALAAAVWQFYEDRDEDKLRAAREAWLQQDSGNFAAANDG